MIVHTASISFIIHIPFVNQYAIVNSIPINNDTISNNLIGPNLASFNFLFLINHRVYDVQTITPSVPTPLPTTLRIKLVTLGK